MDKNINNLNDKKSFEDHFHFDKRNYQVNHETVICYSCSKQTVQVVKMSIAIVAGGCCGFLFSSAVPIAMIVVGACLSCLIIK